MTEATDGSTSSFVEVLIYNMAIPVAAILALQVAISHMVAYAKTLWVEGKSHEWILLMRNGEMVRAGVGLRCFRGPFDQVARFPAKIYKVNFDAEQVTSEMQGVRVSGMLVWTVNRQGTGPFNAYKNLGDISSGDPRAANESLIAEAAAVVRGCIANSTIDVMIRDRNLLRDAIRKEMFEVVKGWGVWLETIEITDVKICSQSLFKDLQTKYREDMRQEATLHKAEIQNEIDEEKNKNDIVVAEKQRDQKEQEKIYLQKIELEKSEAREQWMRDKAEILKTKEELSVQHKIKMQGLKQDLDRKVEEIDLQFTLETDQSAIKNKITAQKLVVEQNKT
jgi:hypothetical protein